MEIRSINNPVQAPVVTPEREAAPAAKPAATTPASTQSAAHANEHVHPAQLDAALKQINESMMASSQNIQFTLDQDSKRTVIQVVDKETHEVLRQIPSKEALEIAKALDNATQGLLIRNQA